MNNSVHAPLSLFNRSMMLFISALLLFVLASKASAQSTEIESPTPVSTNEIAGTITARDIGDSRLTRYFYALTGTPGDLVITVESKNLNGDVDVFAANGLRPLAKVGMYAGELSTSTSKSIYLRRQEPLILRVEGRTPNDNPGTFRIRFEGAFEPIAVAATTSQTETSSEGESQAAQTTTAPRDKNVRRVTSVGGRIDDPEPEPSPTTTASTSTETTGAAQPTTATETSSSTTTGTETTGTESSSTTPAPPARGRRRGRSARPRPTAPAATDTTTTQTEQPAAPAESGARLVIETRDGMRVERYMSTVRRVTVENGRIVVILKNGTIERLQLTDVLRMAIEP